MLLGHEHLDKYLNQLDNQWQSLTITIKMRRIAYRWPPNGEKPTASMVLRSAAARANVAFKELGHNGRPSGRPRTDLRHHLNDKRASFAGRNGPAGHGSRLNDESLADSYDTIRSRENKMQITHLRGQAPLMTRLMQINSHLLELDVAKLVILAVI